MNQELFKVFSSNKIAVIEDMKRKCIVQYFSPYTTHPPSTPSPLQSQIMSLYYFYNVWIFLPLPPRCKPVYKNWVTLACKHTELQHIDFANLFSVGICLCTFHLNCTFMPGSCEKYPLAGDWPCPHVFFHIEPPWARGTKFWWPHLGHIIKMATMPIYGKNTLKSSSPEPKGQWLRGLLCIIRDTGPLKSEKI